MIEPEQFLTLAAALHRGGAPASERMLLVISARPECEPDLRILAGVNSGHTLAAFRRSGDSFRIWAFDRRRYAFPTAVGRRRVEGVLARLRAEYPWMNSLGRSRHLAAAKAEERMLCAFTEDDERAMRAAWPQFPPHLLETRLPYEGIDPADNRVCETKTIALCEAWRRELDHDRGLTVLYAACVFPASSLAQEVNLSLASTLMRVAGGTPPHDIREDGMASAEGFIEKSTASGRLKWVLTSTGKGLLDALLRRTAKFLEFDLAAHDIRRVLRASCRPLEPKLEEPWFRLRFVGRDRHMLIDQRRQAFAGLFPGSAH